MDLLQNPFYMLQASPHDNSRRIMELADERSLLLDSSQCTAACSELTIPRKRLSAEVAWLPGIGPKRVGEVLSLLESSPTDLLAVDNLSSIARANLLAAGLARLPDHNTKDVTKWILELAWAFEDLDADELCEIINEERTVSGFREVSDLSAVEAEIQERRRHYRQIIKSALDHLSPKELVAAVTASVASATEDGEELGPVIIADLVDSYEVEAQGFLNKEEGNIKALVEKLQAAVDAKRSDSTLSPVVNQLIQVVKNWDTVAQPIQVSAKSRGLDHDASHRVASLVRGLAIHMFNAHDKLDFSQQLTNMLQDVFKEVGKVAERTAEDADTLGGIAAQRVLHSKVSEVEELTTQIKAEVDGGRPDTFLSPKIYQLCQLVLNWKIDPEHDASQHTACVVRNLAIHMFNKHDKLDFAQKLTSALLKVFVDAGEISDRLADDAKALQEVAAIRSMLRAGIPQPEIDAYLENVRSGRTNFTPQEAIDFWRSKKGQQSESATRPSDKSTTHGESLNRSLGNPQTQPRQTSPNLSPPATSRQESESLPVYPPTSTRPHLSFWRILLRILFWDLRITLMVSCVVAVFITSLFEKQQPIQPYTANPSNQSKNFASTSSTPRRYTYVRPSTAPNGRAWPVRASYIPGYPQLAGGGLSSVTVDNRRNSSDVFLKLVSLNQVTAYPVRVCFIPAYSQFTFQKVAAGTYYVRYRDLESGGYSKTEPFTLEEIKTFSGTEFSNLSLTLYKVANGNMNTQTIDESEF